jgi:hypothetical protein
MDAQNGADRRDPAFRHYPVRPRSASLDTRSRVRRRLWRELLDELGVAPTEQQRRLMIRITDVEVEIALKHMFLSRGKLDASGVRLLVALDRTLRSLRADLFAPPRAAAPKPEPSSTRVDLPKPEPRSTRVDQPEPVANDHAASLADAIAAGKNDPPP